VFTWIPVLLYASIIFYNSAQPQPNLPSIIYLNLDDLILHFLEYTPFGFLLARAVKRTGSFEPFPPLILPFVVGSTYGLTDEVHQYFVIGRTLSPFDALADSAGVLVGVILWRFWRRRGTNFKK